MGNKQSVGNTTNSFLHNVNIAKNTMKLIYNNENKALKWFCWISSASSLLSIIAISFIFIDANIIVSKESIVLIFIGILATFIVVGNYMQVKDIETKFDNSKKETNEKIKDIQNEFQKIIIKLNNAEKELSDTKSFIEKEFQNTYALCYNSKGYMHETTALIMFDKNLISALSEMIKALISYSISCKYSKNTNLELNRFTKMLIKFIDNKKWEKYFNKSEKIPDFDFDGNIINIRKIENISEDDKNIIISRLSEIKQLRDKYFTEKSN